MMNGITPASTARTDMIRTHRTDAAAKVDTTKSVGLTPPSLAADLVSAMGPPLDLEKIERIRSAIASGHYAVDPAAIADRMVDADLPAAS